MCRSTCPSQDRSVGRGTPLLQGMSFCPEAVRDPSFAAPSPPSGATAFGSESPCWRMSCMIAEQWCACMDVRFHPNI